jgi:hypothetical protein
MAQTLGSVCRQQQGRRMHSTTKLIRKFLTASNVWCYRSTVKGVFQGVRTRSATMYAARMLAAAAAAATVWFLP